MKKKIKFFICCICMSVFLVGFCLESSAVEVIMSSNTEMEEEVATPRSEEIGWVLREINGKWYRRLYNYTTGEYIGDWILCE